MVFTTRFGEFKRDLFVFYLVEAILSMIMGLYTSQTEILKINKSSTRYKVGIIFLVLQTIVMMTYILYSIRKQRGISNNITEETNMSLQGTTRLSRYFTRFVAFLLWAGLAGCSIFVVTLMNVGSVLDLIRWVFIPIIALVYKIVCRILTNFESHRKRSMATKSYIFKYFAFKVTILWVTLVLFYITAASNGHSGVCKMLMSAQTYILTYIFGNLAAKIIRLLFIPTMHHCRLFMNSKSEFHYGEEVVDYLSDLFFYVLIYAYSAYAFPLGLICFCINHFTDKL